MFFSGRNENFKVISRPTLMKHIDGLGFAHAREHSKALLHVLLGNGVVGPRARVRLEVADDILIWRVQEAHAFNVCASFLRQHFD